MPTEAPYVRERHPKFAQINQPYSALYPLNPARLLRLSTVPSSFSTPPLLPFLTSSTIVPSHSLSHSPSCVPTKYSQSPSGV